MLIPLINIFTVILLTVGVLSLVEGILKFWRSVAMMQCQYIVSGTVDVSARSASQYDYLARWLALGTVASKQITWSIVGISVIIILRIAAGALLNAYL